MALAALVGSTAAYADVPAPGDFAPAVWTDKTDYAPGEHVVLSGSNWQPGEVVHLSVNDDAGSTWSHTVDVTASDVGNLTDEFDLPSWFVAVYTVRATGASGATASYSFTDGNITFALASDSSAVTTWSATYAHWTSSGSCTNTADGTPTWNSGDGNVVVSGSKESVKPLSAAATGFVFQYWSDSPTSTTPIADASLCQVGTGSRTYYAHFTAVGNQAPAIARTNATVAVDEGTAAANTGTWSDANAGDTVTLSASVGTVTKAGTNAGGTWSWSYTPTDGPLNSQTVTVTANDGTTSTQTTFALTVNNVTPAVTAPANQSANEGASTSFSIGSFSDPGADSPWAVDVDWGDGSTHTTFNATSAGPLTNQSHTYADGGAAGTTRTVTVKVTDKDGASQSKTFSVTVSNVAPTITAPADQSANEGASTSFNLGSFTDPGSDSPWAVDVDWGDGSTHTTFNATSAGSLTNQSHTYANGPATRTVSVTVTDKDGASDTKTFKVTVNNVAPTTTLSAANTLSVPEGQSRTYSYTISDPGPDTVASVTTSCGANGTKVTGSDTNTNTTGSFQCTFPDGPASSDVSASATDSDGGAGAAATQTVQVTNVAPSVSVTGASTVDEGSTHLYTFTVTDPGQDTFTVDSGYPDCDAGATNNGTLVTGSLSLTASGGTFQCTFADGPSTANVKVKVTDSDGASDSSTQNVDVVTVSNLAPVVTAPADQNASEGTSTSFDLGSFADQGPDANWSVDVDWGDGSTHTTLTKSATGSLGNASHTYADGPATRTVTVQVTDKDGGTDSKTFKVTVANVAPTTTLSAANDTSVNEGSTHTYSYSVTDPGDDAVASVTTSCGVNGVKVSDSAGSFQCSFPDGDATSVVSATATDSDGGIGNLATQAVTIGNVAPSVTAASDQTADEGSSASFDLGSFTDPGADANWTVDVDWGDGSAHTTFDTTAAGSLGDKPHTYADGPATRTVTVQVTDKDGASDSKTFNVDVKNVAPSVTLSASNDTSVDEGSTHTYSYTVTDPGQDTATVDASCGANGTKSNPTATSFDCTFPDGPASSDVSVKATDSDGASSNTAKQTVTVNNVAPSVVVTGDATVDEGTTHTYTFTVSDPGQDTFDAAAGYPTCDTGTLVSDSYSADANGGSFECFFADGPSTANVKMRVTDSDGASDSDTQNVQVVAVANVAPTVTAAADQTADEGTAKSFDLGSFSDPGTDASWSVDVDWGDGSTHTTFTKSAIGSLGNASHSYADGPATKTVTVKVTDKDGASDTKTFTVEVHNVAPTATLSGVNTLSVNEGSTHSYSYTVTDPGDDTIDHVTTDCGVNGQKISDSAGSFECKFPDGDATSVVSVSATDSDNATGDLDTQSVDVRNVAPTLTLDAGNDQSADEGSAHTYSFTVSDPGDDTATVDVSCGDNGTLISQTTGSFNCKFPDGPASSDVTATATDSDGAQGNTDTQSVTVNNVAPTLTLDSGNATTVDEGTTHTYSYTVTDPGQDTVDHVTTDCGTGGVKVSDRSGSFDCEFPDGPASPHVSAYATDSDSAAGEPDSQTVTVDNVAPTVNVSGPANVSEGSTHTYTFTVSDQGDDSFDAADGYPTCDTGALVAGSYSADASGGSFECFFADGPSTANVKMRVTDSDGASDTDTQNVQIVAVANVAPTITAPADQTADEGSSASIDLGSFADPGTDASWSVDVDWGDGSPHTTFSKSATGSLGNASHAYADGPATQTVTVKVTDKDGASDTKTFNVDVHNVAPTAALDAGNATSVNEGSQYTYAYTVTDPGDDTIGHITTDCGANGQKVSDSTGSFTCSFPNGPASSDVTVSATDSDNDTGNTAKQTVTVANLAPTVVLTGSDSADEGQTKTYTFSVTDPGTQDTFSVASGYPDCDAGSTNNGTLVADSLQVTGHSGTFQCFFPDGPSSANVKMKVVDSDNAADTDAQNVQIVSVANVTPTVTAPADQSANEGVSTSLNLGSFTDPGTDASWTVDVDWGDGTTSGLTRSSTGSLGSASHTYADGPATQTVTVKVTDKDGASDTRTFKVDVKNVAPTATLGNDGPIDEGGSSTIAFTSPTDVAPDAAAGFHYAFRCDGTAFPSDPTYAGTGSTASTSCPFPDSGTQTVRARIIDKDDGWREYTTAVTVRNVAPTVTAPTNQSSNEGASASYDLGSFSDPSPHDGPWAVDVAWGDGSAHTTFYAPSRGTLDSKSHTYADNGAYTVTVTVTDNDGGSSSNTFMVNVANVKPTITSFTGTDYLTGVNAYITGGNPLSRLTTVFSDPGSNDQWTAAFTYPDGAPLTTTLGPTFASGQQTTHTFSTAGCKSVSVTVSDKDGGSDTATTTIHVGTGAFQPPMSNAKVTDKLKNGQVLPVKVHITDCSGAGATTLTPAIRLVAGDTTPQNDDSTAQITPTSVSAADTTGVMRSQGGGDYLYNMAVNLPKLNTDYTVVIYPYGTSSPVQLGHVIQATK